MKPFRVALVAGLSIWIVILCLTGNFLVRRTIRFSRQPILEIRAVAHEWWWEFDYPSFGIKTSDVLYIPSATHIRLELASADVIHSFWVAGMKDSVDILPGKTSPLDLVVKSPGEIYGNCDSGCGCGTVCMRFRVLASSPADFAQWASGERLRRPKLKPPHTGDAPACALDTGLESHAERHFHSSHLQRLLDGGEATSKRP
jgi:cytochrome c oxidase subunit II